MNSRPTPARSLADVIAARRRLATGLRLTPCQMALALTEITGLPIWLKREDLQRTGSLKERGARHALLCREPGRPTRGVVAASAGNHALGLAYHGAQLGIAGTVVKALRPRVRVIAVEPAHAAGFVAAYLHGRPAPVPARDLAVAPTSGALRRAA